MSSEVKHYWPEEVVGTGELVVYLQDYAALEAERDALRQQRDKLAQVLGNVEREHELIRQMKNCEIHRGRGSFGIAVMSDPLALDWQTLDKALQQLIDARRAASTGQEAAHVSVPRELLQDLRDLAQDAVDHHRQAYAGYKLERQANMDQVIANADTILNGGEE